VAIDTCLALGSEDVADACKEAGLEILTLDEGEDFFDQNIRTIENTHCVVFGTGGSMRELTPTENCLIGYALARHKIILGWVGGDYFTPFLTEACFTVCCKEDAILALKSMRDAVTYEDHMRSKGRRASH